MLIDLVSFLVAGLAAGGIVLMLNRLTGRRLPKWTVPAAAGLAMVSFAIWSEYSWAERARLSLPETSVVTFHDAQRNIWRPWTFVRPVTTRFAAVDTKATDLPAAPAPDMHPARVYLMQRWRPAYGLTVLFDCAAGRRIETTAEGATLTDLAAADWQALPENDPALAAACEGGGNG